MVVEIYDNCANVLYYVFVTLYGYLFNRVRFKGLLNCLSSNILDGHCKGISTYRNHTPFKQ